MTEQQIYSNICPACGRSALIWKDGKLKCPTCGFTVQKREPFPIHF